MQNANFGTVTHNGKTLTLTQQAYLDCDGSDTGERYYSASAIDADGNEYKVRWEAVVVGISVSLDSVIVDACDWDSPSQIVEC